MTDRIEDVKNGYSNFREKGFREYQKSAIEYVVGSKKKVCVVCLPTGCLTGDTIINMNRGGNGDPVTLENFYKHFNGIGDKRYNYDHSIPTHIRSFNYHNVGLHLVDSVFTSGIKPVYCLTLGSGKTLKATAKHKILTTDGWKELITLTKDDFIMCDSIGTKKSSTYKPKVHDLSVCNLWLHPYGCNVKTTKDKRGYTRKVEIHRAIYEAYMNNITLEEYKNILRHGTVEEISKMYFIDTSINNVHHIDFDHYNNKISNLLVMDKTEHLKLHSEKSRFNFNQGVPVPDNVLSVEYIGMENTYDISCPDFENFIANGMIVHNSGKSLIGTVAAGVLGSGTYLVHSRALQVQLQEDFPELPILWGRGNYRCLRTDGGLSCAECSHSKGNPCGNKASRCEYVVAKRVAMQAPVRILNYDYWITEANYVGGFGDEEFVVIDEADALENVMAKFVGLEFSEGMMRNLGLATPKYKTTSSEKSLDEWRAWASTAKFKVNRKIADLMVDMGDMDPDPELIRRKEKLTGIFRKLVMFIECVDDTWIYEEREWDGKKNISFKPTWITKELAERYVWGHGKKFVLMSATFPPLPVLAKVLGLSMGDIEYREFPSTFPVENRPIVLNPVANLVYSEMEVESEKVVLEIRKLLERHKNEKGLIHAVSYALAKMVMSIGDKRLVTHNGGNKIDAIDDFKNSPEPLVMVSPSSERGISLDGDKCRWICWVKAPYLNLKDKMVSARLFKSPIGTLWYRSATIMSIVQGCGRAVRSRDDFAVTYILDKQIIKLFTENPSLLPRWFREAI